MTLKVRGWGAECHNSKKFVSENQSIENLKSYNISKNQPPRSIRRGNIRVFLFIDFEKRPFLTCLPSNLTSGVEIRHANFHLLIDFILTLTYTVESFRKVF